MTELSDHLADIARGAEHGRLLMPAVLVASLAEKEFVVVHRRLNIWTKTLITALRAKNIKNQVILKYDKKAFAGWCLPYGIYDDVCLIFPWDAPSTSSGQEASR